MRAFFIFSISFIVVSINHIFLGYITIVVPILLQNPRQPVFVIQMSLLLFWIAHFFNSRNISFPWTFAQQSLPSVRSLTQTRTCFLYGRLVSIFILAFLLYNVNYLFNRIYFVISICFWQWMQRAAVLCEACFYSHGFCACNIFVWHVTNHQYIFWFFFKQIERFLKWEFAWLCFWHLAKCDNDIEKILQLQFCQTHPCF